MMSSFLLVLLALFGLLLPAIAIDASTIDGRRRSNDDDDAPSHVPPDDGPHRMGGLRWNNLGASLSPCPLTTAIMLDKYATNRTTTASDGNVEHHCLDDAEWLLHPSSGFVADGSLCGIIGPSGAGKSTFLHALGGTTPKGAGVYLTGSVFYADCSANATDCSRYRLNQKDGDIALLSQHDHFFDMLTPRESLEFAAYLAGSASDGTAKSDAHKEVAERKLSSLGLMGVADRRIGDRTKLDDGGGNSRTFGWFKKKGQSKIRSGGGLSGGERRRLSVALELVTEPKIFLADEPTTGLDSSQAEKVVKLIATLAKERNVPSICTLHQPRSSIWRTLDRFILLAPGGKMCYAGARGDATAYFEAVGYECPPDTNPAEFFIDLVTIDTDDPVQAIADKARIDLLHHRFLESCTTDDTGLSTASDDGAIEERSRINIPTTDPKGLSIIHTIRTEAKSLANAANRFGALLLRSWRQNIRNGRIIVLRLSASIVQAGLFASIFTSVRDDKSLTKSIADRVALLTYGVINMSIMALMKTLDLFAKERSVVMREQMRSSYSSLEYLLAKVFAEIPLDSFFALVFASLLKRLTGLRTSMMTLIKTYCLMTVASVSLGFAIGSITSSVESAMSLGVPVIVIFMVVGVINPSGVDSDGAPNPMMKYLKLGSPIKWAIEALVTSEFRGMAFGEEDRGRWGRLKDLPRMGALAMVQDGDDVLKNLGLGDAKYSQLMKALATLSGAYLLMSWLGLSYFGPSFIDTEDVQ